MLFRSGHWVARFDNSDALAAAAMGVARNDKARERFIGGPMHFHRFRHGGGGFPRADDNRFALGRFGQMRRHNKGGTRGIQRRIEKRTQKLAWIGDIAHALATSWLASFSRTFTNAEWSNMESPCAAAELNNSWQLAVLGNATFRFLAPCNTRFKSF